MSIIRKALKDGIIAIFIYILGKEPVFYLLMLSANQGNYGYNFITSLVWRSPWLGFEPETSLILLKLLNTSTSERLSSFFYETISF